MDFSHAQCRAGIQTNGFDVHEPAFDVLSTANESLSTHVHTVQDFFAWRRSTTAHLTRIVTERRRKSRAWHISPQKMAIVVQIGLGRALLRAALLLTGTAAVLKPEGMSEFVRDDALARVHPRIWSAVIPAVDPDRRKSIEASLNNFDPLASR